MIDEGERTHGHQPDVREPVSDIELTGRVHVHDYDKRSKDEDCRNKPISARISLNQFGPNAQRGTLKTNRKCDEQNLVITLDVMLNADGSVWVQGEARLFNNDGASSALGIPSFHVPQDAASWPRIPDAGDHQIKRGGDYAKFNFTIVNRGSV
jgi:hypothetical protein